MKRIDMSPSNIASPFTISDKSVCLKFDNGSELINIDFSKNKSLYEFLSGEINNISYNFEEINKYIGGDSQ